MKNKNLVLAAICALCGPMALLKPSAEPIDKPESTVESTELGEFGHLPSEAVYKIINNLPYQTLARLGKTSSLFYSLELENTPLHLWTTKKAQSRSITIEIKGDKKVIYSLSFSPDGNILAAGCGDGITRFIDVKTGLERLTLPGVASVPHPVFSTVDNMLILRSWAFGCQLVNLETAEIQQIGALPYCAGMVFSNNGQLLSFPDHLSKIWLASINSNKKAENLRVIKSIKADTKSVAFAPRNKLLAACEEWDTRHLNIYEIDIATGDISKIVHVELPREASRGPIEPSFSTDGTKIAFEHRWYHFLPYVYHLLLWDLINDKKIVELPLPAALGALTFSPDSKIIAAKLHDSEDKIDKKVIVVNVDTGEIITELQPPQGVCDSFGRALTFSPRGDMLAVGYGDGLIMLWKVGD